MRAVANVERHYLVVGLLEHMHSFLYALEHLLPEYFEDATATFQQQGISYIGVGFNLLERVIVVVTSI